MRNSPIIRKSSKSQANEFWGVKQPPRSQFTLKATNLHWGVNEADLREIFGTSMVDCQIQYDESGRSLGEASLAFDSALSRDRAFESGNEQYELDGLVMHLEKVSSAQIVRR